MRVFFISSCLCLFTIAFAGGMKSNSYKKNSEYPVCSDTSGTRFFNTIDTTIELANGTGKLAVYLKTPKTSDVRGVIVVLPGWKLPVMDWCTKTTLCQKALDLGYILIMPEMAKSIYAQKKYAETRADWLQYATREWFIDTLIPYFQKNHKLLLLGQNNFVLGLSTGARGAALLCLDCPHIFKKGAGLSGDYDQTRIPKDALMTGWYGAMDKFPARWTGADNIIYRINEWKVPIYLGHGMADKIVPADQTIQLADSLKKYKPNLVTLHICEVSGHTYEYWDSEVDAILSFFQ